jgi:hypothetical protein
MTHERERLVALIKRWMKAHKGEYVPTFQELKKGCGYEFYNLPNFSECKLQAFMELKDEGLTVETAQIQKRFTARIVEPNAQPVKVKPKKKLLFCKELSFCTPQDLIHFARSLVRLSKMPETTVISGKIIIFEGEE